jgi:dehydrogenase/reductase SDR family protein 12
MDGRMTRLGTVVDQLLEATVVGSFSRIGYQVRRRTADWSDPPPMDGKVVLITGATSGLGLAAATRLAGLGAAVRFLARDAGRAEAAASSIIRASGNTDVAYGLADLSDLGALRAFAATFTADHQRLDVLIHNAGALTTAYRTTSDGTELTVATQLLGPFLLTTVLLPLLEAAAPSAVITVSSGGMYTERFDLDKLEAGPDGYRGVTAYARAKRAQLVLNHEWSRRQAGSGVAFQAMHPGWVDTPGIQTSLPGFRRVMRPLLRTPDEGADTLVWLASVSVSASGGGGTSGDFWHDRHRRSEYKLPWTRPRGRLPGRTHDGDVTDGAQLWAWCLHHTESATP